MLRRKRKEKGTFPIMSVGILLAACLGIYFGAEYTVSSLGKIALSLNVPSSIVALTLLSLGTTLPELVVNISAIRQGKAELAVGNILGSCIFNTLVIPPVASFLGQLRFRGICWFSHFLWWPLRDYYFICWLRIRRCQCMKDYFLLLSISCLFCISPFHNWHVSFPVSGGERQCNV